MSKTYIFYIDGMTCTSCSGIIESFLKSQLSNQLQFFKADITTADPKKTTIILADDEEEHQKVWTELKQHIEEIGFSCRAYDYQPDKEQSIAAEQHTNTSKKILSSAKSLFSSHWFLGGLGCISGTTLLITCLVTSGLSLTFILPLAISSTLLTLLLGANSYYEAWSKLTKTATLTMDSLFALSTISIVVVSLASLFIPWLPMMFDASLLIFGFRHIGIAIEDTIKKKIGSAKFQDRAAKIVRKQSIENIEEINLDRIVYGDVIIVHPGEIIPLDGICENEGIIYNTIITGANLPRHYSPQEKVLAGMRLADNANPLKIKVTKTQKDSLLARLDKAMEKSALEKAPIEIETGRLLAYFIPTVIVLAMTSGLIIGLFFPAAIAIQCAVSVLVSACPCTLGLITPLAVKTGIHKAAENGVQFKSAISLQQAEQIDTVLFDLNGTLTTGVPLVKEVCLYDNKLSEAEFLSLCAALEQKSTHPIGKAIYSFAKKKKPQKLEANLLNDSHHAGVSGQIMDKNYTIGSMKLMQEKGITLSSKLKFPILEAGDQIVYVARENTLLGCMVITDPLRDDALHTIKTLRKMGKEIYLCTGADKDTALRYAQALSIEKIYANCIATSMEEDQNSKTAHIHSLIEKGHTVAMIGDAGNDAQAITSSNLGIAIASEGSDELTQQAADIMIHTGTLLPIATAFAISKQTVSNINQNLVMSMIYNLGSILISGGLLVTAGWTLNPAIGVTLMIFQACIILMNVYRFKEQPLEHLQEKTKPNQENYQHNSLYKKSPSCTDELTDEITPTPIKKRPNNKSNFFSFWSDCIPEKPKTNREEHISNSENNFI